MGGTILLERSNSAALFRRQRAPKHRRHVYAPVGWSVFIERPFFTFSASLNNNRNDGVENTVKLRPSNAILSSTVPAGVELCQSSRHDGGPTGEAPSRENRNTEEKVCRGCAIPSVGSGGYTHRTLFTMKYGRSYSNMLKSL